MFISILYRLIQLSSDGHRMGYFFVLLQRICNEYEADTANNWFKMHQNFSFLISAYAGEKNATAQLKGFSLQRVFKYHINIFSK